ncbi:MAG: hypothetical protein E7472_03510 [Ruminococcaceae bacterium]|nr:hypothetical protein [Oscillospiraceae bacterium]
MKKLLCVFLAAATLLGCCAVPAFAAEAGLGNFSKNRSYTAGLFPDVASGIWYEEFVAAVYEHDLMKGRTDGHFSPGGSVTLAEAVTMAARIHSIYRSGTADFVQGEPWYQVYVDYAAANGIYGGTGRLTAPATRSEFAALLAKSLPESELQQINTIADNMLPDVKSGDANAEEIYRLYRAGVLTGSDAFGTFAPASEINRAEVSAILSRMVFRSLRRHFTPEVKPAYPTLYAAAAQSDEYFADAAMLGNSLVQGMQLYSGMSTMDFFCKESVRVDNCDAFVSALNREQYGKIYIEFGINETYFALDTFITAYGKLIDRLRSEQPEAEIYIMSLTPVTADKAASGFSISKIKEMNAGLLALAEEKACWYMDVFTPLLDASGYLSADYAADWDGAHFNTNGYLAWADVIRTHYAPGK